MKWTETITPKQAVEELGVPYHGWMREMDGRGSAKTRSTA